MEKSKNIRLKKIIKITPPPLTKDGEEKI